MKNRYATFLLPLLLASGAQAQTYCAPDFLNGCFNWRNQVINVGDINWDIGVSDCAISDHTSLSTVMVPGIPEPMSVISGSWTGCAVWVDLNNSSSFEESENMFYSYVGGDPAYEYGFELVLPEGTPAGSYRMRVIAAWGSDGFLNTNQNGFGPCGDFQYGNFDDFTLIVEGSNAVVDHSGTGALPVGPNPTTGPLLIGTEGGPAIDRLSITGTDGRVLLDRSLSSSTAQHALDVSGLPSGVYQLRCWSGAQVRTARIVKR